MSSNPAQSSIVTPPTPASSCDSDSSNNSPKPYSLGTIVTVPRTQFDSLFTTSLSSASQPHLVLRSVTTTVSQWQRRTVPHSEADRLIDLKRRKNFHASFNRSFPFEIMSSIFEICIVTNDSSGEADRRALSQSCHLWRTVVHNTPTLWSTIRFTSSERRSSSIEQVQQSLDRSKNTALSLDVAFTGGTPNVLISLAERLRPHLPRCRNLDLRLLSSLAQYILPLPSQATQLENLSVMLEPVNSLVEVEPPFESTARLCLFDADKAVCAPKTIQIYAPNEFNLALPKFTDLSTLRTLGLAVNMPSMQMLDIAASAPQLRSLDLMVHRPDAIDDCDSRWAYPKLERQRIAGHGCTSFIPAPSLRSLTLVDQASLRAVDQLMLSRSVFRSKPLFPHLKELTFMTPEPAEFDSSPRFENLARFIREHEELVELNIMACWPPIPRLLERALLQRSSGPNGTRGTFGCPRLEVVRLDIRYPIEIRWFSEMLEGLVPARKNVRVELLVKRNAPIPEPIQALILAYPGRLIICSRR